MIPYSLTQNTQTNMIDSPRFHQNNARKVQKIEEGSVIDLDTHLKYKSLFDQEFVRSARSTQSCWEKNIDSSLSKGQLSARESYATKVKTDDILMTSRSLSQTKRERTINPSIVTVSHSFHQSQSLAQTPPHQLSLQNIASSTASNFHKKNIITKYFIFDKTPLNIQIQNKQSIFLLKDEFQKNSSLNKFVQDLYKPYHGNVGDITSLNTQLKQTEQQYIKKIPLIKGTSSPLFQKVLQKNEFSNEKQMKRQSLNALSEVILKQKKPIFKDNMVPLEIQIDYSNSNRERKQKMSKSNPNSNLKNNESPNKLMSNIVSYQESSIKKQEFKKETNVRNYYVLVVFISNLQNIKRENSLRYSFINIPEVSVISSKHEVNQAFSEIKNKIQITMSLNLKEINFFTQDGEALITHKEFQKVDYNQQAIYFGSNKTFCGIDRLDCSQLNRQNLLQIITNLCKRVRILNKIPFPLPNSLNLNLIRNFDINSGRKEQYRRTLKETIDKHENSSQQIYQK